MVLCMDKRGEGLLHEVFGFGWIASEPVGVIVERGEEGDRELLEGCAAVNGGGHDAKCLGRSGIAERRAEEIDWLRCMAANVDDQNLLEKLSRDPDTREAVKKTDGFAAGTAMINPSASHRYRLFVVVTLHSNPGICSAGLFSGI